MKFFVRSQRNVVPMPPERAVGLYQGAKAWINTRVADGTIDCVYSFSDLSGGMSIGNADSPEELLDLLVDYPLWPFFGWEIKPVSDFDHAMDKLTEFAKKLAG